MEDNVKNIVKSITKQKKYNKKFYKSPLFYLVEDSFRDMRGSRLIEDEDEIQWINSLLEMNRNKLFYKSFYRYSLVYNNLIIEKYYDNEIFYVVHNKSDYLRKFSA